jgi:ABC-type transport system involved in multi-copper enzyme maturation permease subunit
MVANRPAPSSWTVIRAIARREMGIARRRKLVRLLFLVSAVPPVIFAVIVVVSLMAKEASGFDLGWDPVFWFLQLQLVPVVLLSLGLGTPLVARDRSEDVLYLYAVRPVTPSHYALGKALAVALPALFLLLIPGILIAIFRQGLMTEAVGTGESLMLVGKVALAALVSAGAFAGITVGCSAATKRARWALLIVFFVFQLPDVAALIATRGAGYAAGPMTAARSLLETMFEGGGTAIAGLISALILTTYAALGVVVTALRVRKEMTP